MALQSQQCWVLSRVYLWTGGLKGGAGSNKCPAWRSGIGNPSAAVADSGLGTRSWIAGGFWHSTMPFFLISTLTQFFAPAEQATIPLVVERRHAVG